MLSVGQQAPDFTIAIDDGSEFKLSDHRGHKIVVYFYPKDDTPGCTTEACDFRESLAQFNQFNCKVIGISRDSIAQHVKFKQKYSLNFPLGSDESGDVCRLYDAWSEKSMFGKKYFGVVRCTYLIDEQGSIMRIWPKVSVSQHIQEILATLKS